MKDSDFALIFALIAFAILLGAVAAAIARFAGAVR